ncbi:MAG TPA: T9SS type A sorting domain-containing protein, partial [Flavobacteriales bacterium]|nr:T9SS type A sorting domain-containing protein [Flavobacteriales bacterium]
PEDNVAKWEDVVVGSYDPNDKRVAKDTVAVEEVEGGTWSDYTIRFQNTGSFLAERVVITDTLSADLDHPSITFISSSHNAQWVLSNGVLVFTFNDIQLPDSASDPIGSQGYVHFRIKLEQDLVPGDVVTNIANIYFDFNAPVITEPAFTSIVLETAVADLDAVHQDHVIAPNPANDRTVLQLPVALERSAQFALYDLNGGLVFQAVVPTGTMNFAFPTHHLAAGLHFFKLVSDQHQVASGPVMVVH